MRGDNAFYDGPIVPVDAYALCAVFAVIVLWPLLCAAVRWLVAAVWAFCAWADSVRIGRRRPRSRLPRAVRRGLAAVPNAAERAALAVAVARSYRRRVPRPPERLTGLAAAFMRWAV